MKPTKKRKHNKISRNKTLKGATPKKPKVIYKESFLSGRYFTAIVASFILLFSLVARAVYVQVIDSSYLSHEADKRSLRSEKLLASRGDILDRNGKLLAVSVAMKSVIADPKVILEKIKNKKNDTHQEVNSLEKDKEKWEVLAKELDLSYGDLVKRIKHNPNSRFVYLSKQTPTPIADYIRKLHLPGIVLRNTSRRFYPEGEETAHLLGYTNIDGEGIDGVEKSFNQFLQGKAGHRSYRKDRSGKVIEDISDIKKYDAQNLHLSIDLKLQSMAFDEIKKAVALNKAKSGSAVLVDIQTGEILAMVNAPSYNPNNREEIDPQSGSVRNRTITDTFEPGSTVKPFVVLAALEHKVVKRDEIINTRGFILNGHAIRDVAPRNEQSLDDILRNSSNRGVSRLALRFGPKVLMDTYQKAGFGKPTELGLIGEQKGILPVNRQKWSDFALASTSYGYNVTATPLQLARAYTTLGSFGIYRPLSITKVDPPVIGKRVFPEKITREIVEMLEKVAEKNKHAMVEGYRVGIKTGTAKKVENGKYVDHYLAYTAGIAPITNPRYALVVLLNDPQADAYYGGAVSAPIFSRIMGYTLRATNIVPDGKKIVKTVKRTVYLNKKDDKKNLIEGDD